MANVKSRIKAPKSASTKKRKGRGKTKSSLTGPNESESLKNDSKNDVVMKRPSNRKVMTPDEKVKFLLKNGHKLKEKFIAKLPANVGRKKKTELLYRKKDSNDLPLMSKSGCLKKKTNCNSQLIDKILKNELMINENGNSKNFNTENPNQLPPSLPIAVNNNNDNAISDQNNSTFEYFSDSGSEYKIAGDTSDTSDGSPTKSKCSNNSMKMGTKKDKKDKLKKINFKPYKKDPRPTHVTLKNGVVLRLDYFECDHCHRTFNRKGSLRRHMMMHLDLTLFTCPHCPKEFINKYSMQVHMKRYHKTNKEDPDLFICNYCDEPFLGKENLKAHLETHTRNESEHKCIYCDKVYSHNLLLIRHEKKHMVKGHHVCTLCSMTYNCRNRLYLHVKSHLKIKDYVCQYCGKEFLRQNSMHRHVIVSHGGHRIVCPICKKNLKGHLTEHMRTHEKMRPHVCPECGQRFTQSTQLNVHRRAHTGAKPYPCQICKRLFSHSNALMLHVRRHTGEKPFPCAMCPMSFSQLPHMKTHMRKIHGKENAYKCPMCNSFFKLKAQLDVHMATCTPVAQPVKDKKKKNKKGEEVIEVEAPMSLSRMRFLLALLLTMIATKDKLKYLGFNKRLIDDILVESLEAMDQTPCKDETLTPLNRLRTNIEMFLIGTVPKKQMEGFKKQSKSTEDILELLTKENENEKKI